MGQALTTAADRARAALVAFAKKVVDIAQKIRDCFIQKNHTLEVIIAHSAAAAYSEKVEAAKKAREHAKGRGKGKAEEAGRHKKGTKPEADQAKENAPSSEEGKQVIRKEDVQPPEESRDGADEESVRRALQLIVMPTVEEVRTIGGMPPVIFPTAEEVAAAKTRVRYEDSLFHFAITGVAGSGKSSLVNALLGRHNKHPDAAKTDVAESTSTIGRYPDPYFPFSNLKDAGLPDQKVYIVSNNPLLTFVKKRKLMPEIIDEVELLYDLLGDAHVRRCVPDDT
ncbi:hypothetical protein ID866_4312 [Astraeus odoratus]|nr:hypothetical protein ID866_4312 [Astraeus odoratus]